MKNKIRKEGKVPSKEIILLQGVCKTLISNAFMIDDLLDELVYHKELEEK